MAAAIVDLDARRLRDEFQADGFLVQSVPLSAVQEHDKVFFNTNNHWENNVRPANYHEVLQKGNTSHWISAFRDGYQTLVIPANEVAWMRRAEAIGAITKRFPAQYVEERDDLVAKLQQQLAARGVADLFNERTKTPWFVRTECTSLKHGAHGVGPYTSLHAIIESLVTSTVSHSPMRMGDESRFYDSEPQPLTLYLIPWQPLVRDQEFRVFVHNNKVTAISQQFLYNVNGTLAAAADRRALILNWATTLVQYHQEVVRAKLKHIESYAMDVAILADGSAWFIEPNAFGTDMASGSALFHWIHDRDALYGCRADGAVLFRYVRADNGSAASDSAELDSTPAAADASTDPQRPDSIAEAP